MHVKHLIRKKCEVISPDVGVASVADSLLKNSFLLVMEQDKYLGVLTTSDIVENPYKLVIDCLRDKPRVEPECEVESVLALMKESQNSVLPVLEDNKLIGVVIQNDIADFLTEYHRELEHEIAQRKQAKQELQVKTAILQNIICNIPYYVFWKDKNSIYLGCNDNFMKLAGVENPEDIIGKTDYDLPWRKEESDFYRKIDKEVISKGAPILNIEEPIHHGQGKLATLLTSKVPLRNADGEITGVLGIFTDITERKKAEKVLREEKDRAKKYLDIAGVMLLVVNANGTVELINRRGCEILGYSEDEIIGKNWFNTFIAEPIREEIKGVFRKLMAGKVEPVEYYENPVITKSGEERLIAWHNTILRDEHGNIIGSLSSAEDITERKRAEQKLAESEHRYRTLADSAPIGIGIATMEGQVLTANKAMLEMTGYLDTEIRQINIKDTYQDPEKRTLLFKQLERDGFVRDFEVQLKRKDGTLYWASLTVVPLFFRGEHAVLTTAIDITENKKAEQALQESQSRQRAILDSIPDIAWLKDTESRYIAANKALCKAFDIKLEDLVGKTDFDISPEDLAKRYRADDQEVMKSGQRKRVEELWGKKHGKGKRIWIETIKTPIYNDQGQVIGTSGIARDITKRKKAEEALRESEEKYRKLFEETTDAIFVGDAETGIIVDCNRAASELVGREKLELIGKHQRILHPPQKIEGGFSKTFKQHLAENEGQVLESQVITKKGEIKDVEIRASRFELKGEKRIQGLFRDVTERKKAEEQIRKLSTAVEQSIDGIAIGDLEPRLLYVNEAFARMHGYKPEDMIGMPITKLHNKKQMPEYKKTLNKLNKKGSWQGEIRHIRKDGTVFPVYLSVTLLRGDNGKPLGTLAVNRDITESKRREQELDSVRKRVTRAEELATLGSLAAALAHELTQPLTVINLLIENALTDLEITPYPGTMANKLTDVLTEVSRIKSVAHKFRDAAKRSSERIVRQVDLKGVAERTLKLCDDSARRAKVTLQFIDFDRLPSIYSNEGELEQVFFALMDNAIQAADGKKAHQLVISGILKDKHVELQFSDNCGGIAPENLDKIFEPFFTTKPAGEAMGLGLCIVEHIVSRAGGKVHVESKPGEGTTFYITLPINIHVK